MKNRLLSISLVLCTTLCLCSCGKNEVESSVDNITDEVVEETATLADSEEADSEPEIVEEPEIEEPETEEELGDENPTIQEWWGGEWYGIMWFTGTTGDYSQFENMYWDAMATVDIDEDNNADMLLWYEAVTMDSPVANVQLTISKNSDSEEMGVAVSESGWMFVNSDTGNGDVEPGQWTIDPMTDPISSKYGNDMIHIEGAYIDGSGEIYYHFFLRKWGDSWDDVVNDPEMLSPGYYEEWYKPMIEEGYAMPANVLDEGTVMMSDLKPGESALITSNEDNYSTN